MIRPHDLRRFSILLGAASLTGCGALALDRLAAEHSDRARRAGANAASLAQSQANRADFEAARDTSYAEMDRALALASSPDAMVDILSLRAQLDLAANQPEAARRAVDRMRAISPRATATAMLTAELESATDPKRALAAIEDSLRIRPAGEELLFMAGMLELETGAAESAARRFARLITVSTARGSDWLASGRIGRAVALTMETSSLPNREIPAEVGEHLRATVDDDVSTTVFVLEEFGARGPKFENALREATDAAATTHPQDVGLGFLKAYVARATGFPDAALQEIERLLDAGAGERETDLLWLAFQAHSDLDQQAAALVRARRLLERMPWHMPALYAYVQSTLNAPGNSPDRAICKKFIDAARAHFEARRTAALESAGRSVEDRQARSAESARYLQILDSMDQALARR